MGFLRSLFGGGSRTPPDFDPTRSLKESLRKGYIDRVVDESEEVETGYTIRGGAFAGDKEYKTVHRSVPERYHLTAADKRDIERQIEADRKASEIADREAREWERRERDTPHWREHT